MRRSGPRRQRSGRSRAAVGPRSEAGAMAVPEGVEGCGHGYRERPRPGSRRRRPRGRARPLPRCRAPANGARTARWRAGGAEQRRRPPGGGSARLGHRVPTAAGRRPADRARPARTPPAGPWHPARHGRGGRATLPGTVRVRSAVEAGSRERQRPSAVDRNNPEEGPARGPGTRARAGGAGRRCGGDRPGEPGGRSGGERCRSARSRPRWADGSDDGRQRTSPQRKPSATACARSEAPSFLNNRRAWVFTVSSERNSSRPISALDRP